APLCGVVPVAMPVAASAVTAGTIAPSIAPQSEVPTARILTDESLAGMPSPDATMPYRPSASRKRLAVLAGSGVLLLVLLIVLLKNLGGKTNPSDDKPDAPPISKDKPGKVEDDKPTLIVDPNGK